jgi:hypothetical protein
MNWKVWFHGFGAAAIGGAASAAAATFAEPQDFNFTHAGLVALGKVVAAGAIIPALAYLKQSPLPSNFFPVPTTHK